jgi:glycosyltransferase involved in cell wall biosynthesis
MRHRCIHGSLIKSILGVMEAYLHRLLGSYRKVDCYLCPSSFLEQKLLAENSFYRGKTRVIHNFIEKSEIPHLDPNRQPYVVFVGRLSAEKGIRLLAEAARLLPEVRFLVAGNGPDGAELEGMENVSLLGFVSGKDLTCLMAGATLLVAPSVCFENCPLSILESHALGVPVVTMNYGGMAELVEDGKTGTLVKEPTAEALADAIRRTLSDPKQYEIMKEHCRERSEQILTAEEYTALVIEEYQKWMNA